MLKTAIVRKFLNSDKLYVYYYIMIIIHVLNYVKDCGNGIACATVDLACEQVKSGHTVYVISGGGGFTELLEKYGVRNVIIDQTRRPLTIIKSLYKMHAILSDIKPDIVHAQMMTGVVLGKILKPLHTYTLISTVHNEWQKSSIVMRLADQVITVSKDVKAMMVQRGIPAQKMHVVLNGTIGSPRDKPIDSEIILQRPSISTVCGLYKRKGIICLITAFGILQSKIPDAHLYIIGEGSDREEFETLARRMPNPENIHFEGFQSQPKSYLLQTDIFCPAITKRAFWSIPCRSERGWLCCHRIKRWWNTRST